jgi:hypothetical protein
VHVCGHEALGIGHRAELARRLRDKLLAALHTRARWCLAVIRA